MVEQVIHIKQTPKITTRYPYTHYSATGMNTNQKNIIKASWAYIENRLDEIMEKDLPTLEHTMGYTFKRPEFVLIAVLSKRALAEYLLYPGRKYLSDDFLQEALGKVDSFATLGDAIISAIVCSAHFLQATGCTRHSMSIDKSKHTTNTRWEFLMKLHGIDKMIVGWPREISIQSLLRLVMESLCAVILLDCGSITKTADIITKLIYPEDYPPEKYGSCRIEIHRVFVEAGIKHHYQDAKVENAVQGTAHTQELVVDGEVVGVGVAENKESAQEAAAHDFVIGGGFATITAIHRAMKTETKSVSKEKRHGESTKEDYFTGLANILCTVHGNLRKKVMVVPFTMEDTNPNNNNRTCTRLLCYITHEKHVISAYVSDSKLDGIAGCLKRLYGYITRGEECIEAHAQEPVLRHPIVNSILQANGALTVIPVKEWKEINHEVISEIRHMHNTTNQQI